jgi:hypothetical protein
MANESATSPPESGQGRVPFGAEALASLLIAIGAFLSGTVSLYAGLVEHWSWTSIALGVGMLALGIRSVFQYRRARRPKTARG